MENSTYVYRCHNYAPVKLGKKRVTKVRGAKKAVKLLETKDLACNPFCNLDGLRGYVVTLTPYDWHPFCTTSLELVLLDR